MSLSVYRSSLDNVEVKWLEEIHEHCPGVKLCLVALKCDLREEPSVKERLSRQGEVPVSYEDVRRFNSLAMRNYHGICLILLPREIQGLAVARRIRASRYLECSAKHGRGVNEVFQEAAKVSVRAPTKGQTRTSVDDDERHGVSKLFGCFRW